MSEWLIFLLVMYGFATLAIGIIRVVTCYSAKDAYSWLRSELWDDVSICGKIIIVLLNILFFPGLLLSFIIAGIFEVCGCDYCD